MPEQLERNFFRGKRRRELKIMNYLQLMTAEGEKRKKLYVRDVLDGDSLIDMPEWIAEGFNIVAAGNGTAEVDFVKCRHTELQGMTVEVYKTEKGMTRQLLLTHGLMKNFAVERVGKEEKAEFFLSYTINVPDSPVLHDWLDDNFREDIWVKFDSDQMELPVGEAAAESKPALVGDKFDDERREALAPENDGEFHPAVVAGKGRGSRAHAAGVQ